MRTVLAILGAYGIDSIQWASAIAQSSGHELIVLCVSKDSASRLDTVGEVRGEQPDLVVQVCTALSAPDMPHPEVYDCRGPLLHRAVLDAVVELGAQQLILPMDLGHRTSSVHAATRRLIHAAPVDVLAIDVGRCRAPERVIIPQIDGGGAFAIQYAARFVGRDDIGVTVLPDGNKIARSRRVFTKTRDRLSEARQGRLELVENELPLDRALADRVVDCDLVLISADSAPKIKQLISKLVSLRQDRPETDFAVGVVREAHAAGSGRLERALERLRQHAPMLTREERRDIHNQLELKGGLSTEFIVMMVLSASIAALGLIQSSTAVVIGAMLVAPLMTPLVAIGMSLVQGNPQLFRRAVNAMLVGIVAALVASMGIGLMSPWTELSSEIHARGAPNVFDLFIALLSGIAAAFALARPGLTGTLVGVAIAVALVPPLASVGISIVKGHFSVAFGAVVLFSTNLFAIVVGTAVVFRYFGLDTNKHNECSPRWVRNVMLIVLIGLIPVTAVLIDNLQGQLHEGVHRPYARPLPPTLRHAIEARVEQSPGTQLLMMAQSEIVDDFGIEVILITAGSVDPSLEADILALIDEQTGDRVPSRVVTLRAAD